jgi:hypothetical protein
MQIQVPPSQISIGTNPTNGHRQLQFTHVTADVGTGPFEIDPTYNAATGTATFQQAIYNSPSPGVWQLDHKVGLAVTGVFNGSSDYDFPLTRFTLNTDNGPGSVGSVVATSPKSDYCITGDTQISPSPPNTPSATSPPVSNCTDPTKPLGWSVGWGDEYDQTDAGQPIDLTGIPDGTYDLVGIVDPQHIFTESDNTNNVTVTRLQISGNLVTFISQATPTSVPPTVAITSPASNASVSGTVNLAATATGAGSATINSVQWMLNGQPLSAPLTTAPYSYAWNIGSIPLGTYTLSAQAVDSNGNLGTGAESVNVINNTGGLTIDQSVKATGTGTATAALNNVPAGETLLAFVASDGASGQTATVSGGLTWTRVQREDAQLGDAEIWTATTATSLSSLSVTSKLAQNYGQQLAVLALSGSSGIGTSAVAAASSGAPSVSLTTSAAGSLSFAVGNDYDTNTARTLSGGQFMVAETQAGTGDDYWVQATTTASTVVGQTVTLSDTAPTGDRWNLAAAEVVPSGSSTPPPPDTTPPTVNITNPVAGQTLSGTATVAANASDNVAVAKVQFLLDGQPLGSPVTAAPYAISWDTTTATNGSHTLSAIATDTSGNTAPAANVSVTVQNPAPPMTCFVLQAQRTMHGRGKLTTTSFNTVAPGEVLLAFVGADGPAGAGKQTATISGGAGLTWKLVKRANAQSGDAEVWTATAANPLTGVKVSSSLLKSSYDQDLTVIAMEGAAGTGTSAAASAASGAPSVSLTTTAPAMATSLVFGVGNDWDQAIGRLPVGGQVILEQWVDTGNGDTYWSQYTNTAVPTGTTVTLADSSPTTDQWNFVGVELVGETE